MSEENQGLDTLPRLADVFNISGSEVVLILLLALVVLGPEKLPEALRRFGRVYGEVKRISTGFQSEFRDAFEEPMRELRETAQLTKDAVHKATQADDETSSTDGESASASTDLSDTTPEDSDPR